MLLPIALLVVISMGLALWRGGLSADATVRPAAWAAGIALVGQTGHFLEEATTGIHARFPALFDEAPVPLSLFIGFNVMWLGIWAASIWGLARRRSAALFPLWFLGVAGVGNGILHPLLALNAGSYFPGLITSPVMAGLGGLLLVKLFRVTR